MRAFFLTETSWNINFNTPDYTYKAPAGYAATGKGAASHYPRPREQSVIPNTNPYAKIYITNAVPHAYKVEYEGTPTHSGGWEVAIHARNLTLGKSKFF